MYIQALLQFFFDRQQKDLLEVPSSYKNQLSQMARLQIAVLFLDQQ